MPPLDPAIKNGSMTAMMNAEAAGGPPPSPPPADDADDTGEVTCPNCGCGFGVKKQTTYEAGPVTTPPAGGAPPSGGGMPPAGAM